MDGRPVAFIPTTITWRQMAKVLVPFWAYVTLSNTLILILLYDQVGTPDILARVLQHVALLPVLMLCYRQALRIGLPADARTRAVLKQLALGFGFAFLARFVTWATFSLVMWDPSWMTSARMELGPELRAIGVNLLNFFLPYWLGLSLLVGVLTYRRLRDETLRAARMESEFVRARLQALHGQLNPHFLFNTLHSVCGLVDEQPQVAKTMLVRLGDLLRRSLREGNGEQIRLRDELEIVQTYLEIQQLRFSDRLSFHMDIEPGLESATVPSLLLQPLAENAIVHGMADAADHVDIRIDGRRIGEDLELTVTNSSSRPAADVKPFGVGLGNTSERLKTLYGKRASLSCDRPRLNEFVVRVLLPFESAMGMARA